MKLKAEWRDDCQGKKDYDALIVRLSTRFWPGSYQTDGKCSAHAAILIESDDVDYDLHPLVERDFAGSDEAEVKQAVETWAQDKFEQIVTVLKAYYGAP